MPIISWEDWQYVQILSCGMIQSYHTEVEALLLQTFDTKAMELAKALGTFDPYTHKMNPRSPPSHSRSCGFQTLGPAAFVSPLECYSSVTQLDGRLTCREWPPVFTSWW